MNYRAIPHGERKKSASEMMGRQLRSPILCSNDYHVSEKIWYQDKPAQVLVQRGPNTFIVKMDGRREGTLAHQDQIKRQGTKEEDRKEEEKVMENRRLVNPQEEEKVIENLLLVNPQESMTMDNHRETPRMKEKEKDHIVPAAVNNISRRR